MCELSMDGELVVNEPVHAGIAIVDELYRDRFASLFVDASVDGAVRAFA